MFTKLQNFFLLLIIVIQKKFLYFVEIMTCSINYCWKIILRVFDLIHHHYFRKNSNDLWYRFSDHRTRKVIFSRILWPLFFSHLNYVFVPQLSGRYNDFISSYQWGAIFTCGWLSSIAHHGGGTRTYSIVHHSSLSWHNVSIRRYYS